MDRTAKDLVALPSLNEGEEGIIQEITGGHVLASRLAGLGIVPGARVKLLRGSGGPVIVEVAGTRVALGAGEASKIMLCRVEPVPVEEPAECKTLLVALAGQPNVGKSTVFNILTGLSQHVGNWPGKTVEKKEGTHTCENVELRIVDLPGTYSLTAFSEEERVARDFIINVTPDVIVLLVNAAALERSLYLLSELLLLGPPVIVAVNMIDVAEAQGIRVDVQALQKALGIPVVPMVATKNRGIRDLLDSIIALSRGEIAYNPRIPNVSADHQAILAALTDLIADYVKAPYTVRWTATKLMEGDPEISQMIEKLVPAPVWREIQRILVKHEDALHAVVGGRYDWVEEVTRAAISRPRLGQVLITDRIDHVLTRPVFGIPILLCVMAAVLAMTYQIGFPMQKALESAVAHLARATDPVLAHAPAWVKGLVIDGVIAGAGSVLTFLPILLIFFAVMAFLEDVGYMARAAFVMDRFMHVVGLHGKSFLPLCLGLGCNVPAILGARIVESRKERLLTMFLAPFVPCTARLAVLTFVTAALFAERAAAVSWALISLNVVVLGIVGMATTRLFLKKEEPTPFIMELPLYHRPDPRTIAMVIWTRTVAFVKRAGTVILTVSVAVWFLSYLPGGQVEGSFLARFGRLVEPIGAPLGLDWKMIVALLTGVVAKENAVATLGVLYGVGEEGLVHMLPNVVTHASAVAFLVVLMLFIPCAATVAAMRREMGNRKWFLSSFATMLVISYLGGLIAYRFTLWVGL